MSRLAVIVLAGGQGKRMKSAIPKPLMSICGKPMIFHVLDSVELLAPERVIVVVGHGRDQVIAALAQRKVEFAVQDPPLGTGHAVQCAAPSLSHWEGDVLVTCADVPLVRTETFQQMIQERHRQAAAGVILTGEIKDPRGYGRIVRADDGSVVAIVEEADASEEVRAIREVNLGVYVFESAPLFDALNRIEPANVQGEFYLTDVIAVLVASGRRVAAYKTDDPSEAMGVNDRIQLADAEAIARGRVRQRLMLDGVTIVHPDSTFIDDDVYIGRDTVILPGTHIYGRSHIGSGCTIGPNAYIQSSSIGDSTSVLVGAVIRDSEVGSGCTIGPYCHIRDSSRIHDNVRVGSYTEIVRTQLFSGTRALHFSYLGDATVGPDANIGAGVVTCNYDGRQKHRTVIESGAFVGSDAILVAPVTIGKGAYVAAGSVITEDVPAGALAIARERQSVKEGWVQRRFLDRGQE
ncbi:MAG: bifunctional UDP-N-acetylglucosamine diphosphorylase/glucosamine-1-phosphate N-acetyltransferase GlmU [Armatimonadetes bacterium]|nr:bifunctional UDP-N-acetylglucosamine diphosphorylase/glucosamine-1-phosphate N-acetyltransferase GlmU [Armatimonadota bacterium]